ncbi:MAG: hypothetical protein WB609_09845 [Candidatus Cybelea sp.]
MPRRKGKPRTLTAAVEEEICASLEIGMPEKLAAQAAGIPERTFHYWCQQGRDDIEPYASFLTEVERARAIGAKNLLTRVLKGEKGSTAAQWVLERRFPREFGPRVMLGGIPDGDPIQLDSIDRIRESPEASALLHRAIVAAAEAPMDAGHARDGAVDASEEPES